MAQGASRNAPEACPDQAAPLHANFKFLKEKTSTQIQVVLRSSWGGPENSPDRARPLGSGFDFAMIKFTNRKLMLWIDARATLGVRAHANHH